MTLQLQTVDGGCRWHQKAIQFAAVKWWPARSTTDTRQRRRGQKHHDKRELHTSEFKGAHLELFTHVSWENNTRTCQTTIFGGGGTHGTRVDKSETTDTRSNYKKCPDTCSKRKKWRNSLGRWSHVNECSTRKCKSQNKNRAAKSVASGGTLHQSALSVATER